MDHHRDKNTEHKLAQEIKDKTIAALQQEHSALHTRFHLYVSFPPENFNALVYFNTVHAIEEFNLSERTDHENRMFNDQMNLYGKYLYETHDRIKKQLTSK